MIYVFNGLMCVGLRDNPFNKVYELNGLFMDLSAHIGGTGLSRFEVTDQLSTYKYDHDLGLRYVCVLCVCVVCMCVL